jgi:hypothetical protein
MDQKIIQKFQRVGLEPDTKGCCRIGPFKE